MSFTLLFSFVQDQTNLYFKYLALGLIAVVLNPLSITDVPVSAVRQNNRDFLAKCLPGRFLQVNMNSSSEDALNPHGCINHPSEVDYFLLSTLRPFSAVYSSPSFFCLLHSVAVNMSNSCLTPILLLYLHHVCSFNMLLGQNGQNAVKLAKLWRSTKPLERSR